MQMKKFKTDVLINNDKYPEDDLQFIRTRGLKPTNLLRMKIKELRAIEDGEPDAEKLMQNLKNVSVYRDKLIKFITEKGLFDEFFK